MITLVLSTNLVEERFALFTISAHCIVLTVVTDTARDAACSLVDGRIVMAPVRVLIAVAPFTGVGLSTNGRSPWKVVVKVFTLLTIKSFGVVSTLAAAVDHVGAIINAGQRQATRCVTVT